MQAERGLQHLLFKEIGVQVSPLPLEIDPRDPPKSLSLVNGRIKSLQQMEDPYKRLIQMDNLAESLSVLFSEGSPIAEKALQSMSKEEKSLLYTACQLYNDLAKGCRRIAEDPNSGLDQNALWSEGRKYLVEKEMALASRFGLEDVVVKTTGNLVVLSSRQVINKPESVEENTKIINGLISSVEKYIRIPEMQIMDFDFSRGKEGVEYLSALDENTRHPDTRPEVILKYVVGSLSNLAQLCSYSVDMRGVDPFIAKDRLDKAKKALEKSGSYYMQFLKPRELGGKFDEVRMALDSNFIYIQIQELYLNLNRDFGNIQPDQLVSLLTPCIPHLKDLFMSLENDEIPSETRDNFKVEIYSRAALIANALYLARTQRNNPTLGEQYLKAESTLTNLFLAALRDFELSKKVGSTYRPSGQSLERIVSRLLDEAIRFPNATEEDKIISARAKELIKTSEDRFH